MLFVMVLAIFHSWQGFMIQKYPSKGCGVSAMAKVALVRQVMLLPHYSGTIMSLGEALGLEVAIYQYCHNTLC